MITHKGIKNICAIVMGLCYAATVILILLGISFLSKYIEAQNNQPHNLNNLYTGLILIVIAILCPLITTISLYPIFALANIDEHTEQLDYKFNIFLNKMDEIMNQNKQLEKEKNDLNDQIKDKDISEIKLADDTITDLFNYLNELHHTNILVTDEIEIIKEKINNINEENNLIKILKERTNNCSTLDEIVNVIKLYCNVK